MLPNKMVFLDYQNLLKIKKFINIHYFDANEKNKSQKSIDKILNILLE